MRKLCVGGLLFVTLMADAGAQTVGNGLELSGMVGAQFRSEQGRTIDGGLFVIGLVLPSSSETRWGLDLGLTQMNAHTLARLSVVESSVEVGATVMRGLVTHGNWHLEGGVSALASRSSGCRHDTDLLTDPDTTGPVTCPDSYAKNGTVRFGGRLRLLSEWRTRRASFFVTAFVSANTIASGDQLAPGLLVGFRAPIGTR